MQITPVVKQLLILNIIVFAGCMFIPNADDWFALFYFENPQFKPWQVVTHMFMHGDVMHIAFNMFGLYSFGSHLEHFWGGKKFLFFYFSCGLGAALIHTGVNYYQYHHGLDILLSQGFSEADILSHLSDNVSDGRWAQFMTTEDIREFGGAYLGFAVGASGAIYGLLAAFAMMFPNAELFVMFIPVPIRAKFVVPGLILLDFFSGITKYDVMGSNVAHFAHIGGALFGILMMLMWRKNGAAHNRWN